MGWMLSTSPPHCTSWTTTSLFYTSDRTADFSQLPMPSCLLCPSSPLSVGASPSRALHPGSVPTAIWLWSIIWNSHAFKVDTAGAISQHSRGVLSGWRRWWREVLAQPPAALRGSAWQMGDLCGKKWQQSHVCECSDCYWLTTWLGNL